MFMPSPRPPLERSIKISVLRHLKELRRQDPSLCYRKRHGSAFVTAGDPDICGLWRGVHFEIELKQPGENPTPLQRLRLEEWGRAGARTFVVHNLLEFQRAIEEIATWRRWKNGPNPIS